MHSIEFIKYIQHNLENSELRNDTANSETGTGHFLIPWDDKSYHPNHIGRGST